MFQLAMSQAGDSSKVTTRGSRVATSESNQDTTSAQPDRQDIDASDASDDIFAELFPELERYVKPMPCLKNAQYNTFSGTGHRTQSRTLEWT